MTKDETLKQLSYELFDLVKKYHNQLTTAELIGVLEIHKQESLWHHFEQVKQEMIAEQRSKT
jgi:hypothetical protein